MVAAINYRLGTHKIANYDMYWACNNSISQPCAYIADSSEIVRALFRGMQDTKGAIRFMKNRAQLDSTDINNVFLAGESAGGFNVLAAAFMRDESQKPLDCFAINNANTPDVHLRYCLPAGYSLARPDLGSVDGSLHIGNSNSTIKGVANFYGGIFDINLLVNSNQKPAMYLFHQGSDVVVDYIYNRVFGRINWECFAPTNVCQQYSHTPFAYGSEGIRRQLDSMGTQAPLHQADIVSNYNYLNDCFANGHSIDNVILRTMHMAELFSVVIDSSGNSPALNCSLISVNEISEKDFIIYPNPGMDRINIEFSKNINIEKLFIRDLLGRKLDSFTHSENFTVIHFEENIKSGIYFLDIETKAGRVMKKIFLQKN